MPVIGTAGHVDHGKSTLVQGLTGLDPDRWAEEKRRGLTIDLGFAWTTLGEAGEVSFVDVPGHQRFVKNLLAGIEAIDVALLVVAADEGWMPQTEEHLGVLTVLEVPRGVVAVTRKDLADTELFELVATEVSERIVGTALDAARVIGVSAVTGEGIADLRDELGRLAASSRPRDLGRPRLWVDRAFTPAGVGLVVTGTLLDGAVSVGDELAVYPSGETARVRGLQTHETKTDRVGPGTRAALNLSGAEGLQRGDMLGRAGEWRVTRRFVARVSPTRYVEGIEGRGDHQIHVGTTACPVEIVAADADIMLLLTDRMLPLAVGDRFVIRDTGRRLVVGGGRVLDPRPGRTKRALAFAREIDPGAGSGSVADALLAIRGRATASELATDSGGGVPGDGVRIGDTWMTRKLLDELTELAVTAVEASHREHPLRDGLPLSTLASRLGVEILVATWIVDAADRLVRRDSVVALAGHRVEIGDEAARVLARLGRGLAVPTVSELGADIELIHLMCRRGDLVRISPDLVMLPDQVETIVEVIRGFEDAFTVAEMRDRTQLSRKYLIPILEWADREGLTVRVGERRRPL